jgi:transposase, IS5 family
MERSNREPAFVDAMTLELGGPRTGELLDRLDQAVNWEALAGPVRQLPMYQHTGAGRRPWDAVVMVKCLMLQRWFGLSDPQLEEQLRDRLSFRRFMGLSLLDGTPDETSLVRFRERLREARLDEQLFADVLGQLTERGLRVQQGTIVDATVIEQSRGRRRPDGTNTRDTDASYTKKHGQPMHGYKAHVASSLEGIITGCEMTTAKVHDSQCIDELTEAEEHAVLADSAYESAERRRRLRDRGVIDGICYKRRRGQKKLPAFAERWNQLVSRIRGVGERPFAVFKRQMNWRRVRYRGLARNRSDLKFHAAAYNIRHALSLIG